MELQFITNEVGIKQSVVLPFQFIENKLEKGELPEKTFKELQN